MLNINFYIDFSWKTKGKQTNTIFVGMKVYEGIQVMKNHVLLGISYTAYS